MAEKLAKGCNNAIIVLSPRKVKAIFVFFKIRKSAIGFARKCHRSADSCKPLLINGLCSMQIVVFPRTVRIAVIVDHLP